jgi:V/A-type H+-transporting ATPase subunit F
MKKVLTVTARDARYGFALAGIDQHAAEAIELEEVIVKAVTDTRNGLVIVDERLISGMDEERFREIERSWTGVVVVLPSPVVGPAEVEDYAARLIRRAIGYHVRIRL